MFIYKFMAGIVEVVLPSSPSAIALRAPPEQFDPHLLRKIEHPTSYLDTMIHMLKGSIGAGILAMPQACKRIGVTASACVLIAVGIFATYCLQLLIAGQYELCKRWRRGYLSFAKSMRLSIQDGPPSMKWSSSFFYWFVEIMLLLWQLGICCIYLVFVASNNKQVFDYYGMTHALRLHLLFLLVPAILLNLVKKLKLLTPLSAISNVATIIGLSLVLFYLIEDDLVAGSDKMEFTSINEIPLFVGTALFALEAVGVVLALEYNMEHPKQFVGFFGLLNIGMFIIVVMYLGIGVVGYLKYGSTIQASITLNLPEHEKKAQVAKLTFSFAIFLSFPLQNFVAYSITWRHLKKTVSSSAFLDYLLRVILVLIPWLLAVAIPTLGPFIALFGALCLSMLAMVFPAILDVCLWYSHPKGYGKGRYKLIRGIFIIIVGVVIMVFGVYTSVEEIIEELNK